jgi:hypothetical protein
MIPEKIFEPFSYINTCKKIFPNCDPTRPGGHGFNKLAFVLCQKASVIEDLG